MNINQLKYFQTVCEFNNITKAAEKLHVSQPSVSWAVKELEEELGVVLFNRSKNKIHLTETGGLLLGHVNYILNYMELLTDEIKAFDSENKSILRLGLSDIGMQVFLQTTKYEDCFFPDWNIVISEDSDSKIKKKIKEQSLEYGIVLLDQQTAQQCAYQIITEVELCYCINHKHPLAQRESVKIPELIKYPLMWHRMANDQNQIIAKLLKEYGVKPKSNYFTTRQHIIEEIIRNRTNVGSILIKEMLENTDGITAVSLDPPIKMSAAVIWSSDHRELAAKADFPEAICREYEHRVSKSI